MKRILNDPPSDWFHRERRFRDQGREEDPVYERIYAVVRQIPRGQVATYGQIARIVDRCTARMVGYAMAALRGRTDVPWQRVINSRGEISTRSRGDGALRQRKSLEKEGIRFGPGGRINLRKVRWSGKKAGFSRKPPAAKGSGGEGENEGGDRGKGDENGGFNHG